NWNTRDLLAACLLSLAAPDGMPDGTEVIVVDNGSSDDSVAYLREHAQWVRLIAQSVNNGFAAATNVGLSVARGEHLLLLNSDTEACPGALTAMVAHLRRHPEVGVVGADVRNPDGSAQPCRGRAPSIVTETFSILGLDRRFRMFAAGRYRQPRAGIYLPCAWVLGAALMVRRATYAAIGPLDEGYFMYSEEIDWCARIRAGGWGVGMLAGARVIHLGGGSTRRTGDRMRPALFRSKVRYLALHQGAPSAHAFRFVIRMVAALHVVAARVYGAGRHEEVASWRAVFQSI
ncbi:MAG TPA: glycosyltransferase family 2 protein, partial [Thermomicrobiales bacterium]